VVAQGRVLVAVLRGWLPRPAGVGAAGDWRGLMRGRPLSHSPGSRGVGGFRIRARARGRRSRSRSA
jgi:hypothetical protein